MTFNMFRRLAPNTHAFRLNAFKLVMTQTKTDFYNVLIHVKKFKNKN